MEPLAEGRFHLLEVLGQGGMATVFRAFDERLQRPRAIKVLLPQFANRHQLRARFLAEAQTMATLEDARVVRVFDTGVDGHRVYIVMELLEGGSLTDRVTRDGPLPPRMAVEVMIQLGETLSHAHAAGIVHRDIKPHNILLTRGGEIKVTDFGIAQVRQDQENGQVTRTGTVLGTWGYMAPEQKSNAKLVDTRADIYSTAATLWSLLRGDTPPELFMAHNEPGMLDGMPPGIAEVILKATRYRREERYANAADLVEALRGAQVSLPSDPEGTPPLVQEHAAARPARSDTYAQLIGDSLPASRRAALPALLGTTMPEMRSADQTTGDEEAPLPAAPVAARHPVYPINHPNQSDPEVRPAAVAPRIGIGAAILGLTLAIGVGVLIARAVPPSQPAVTSAPPATTPIPTQVAAAAETVTSPSLPQTTPSTDTPSATGAPPSADTAPAAVAPPTTMTRPGTGSKANKTSGATSGTSAATPPSPPAIPAAAQGPAPPAPSAGKLKVTASTSGGVATFSAQIEGDYAVTLYYRATGGTDWSNKSMTSSGNSHAATLTLRDEFNAGIDYSIKASAGGGRETERAGSQSKPLRLAVK